MFKRAIVLICLLALAACAPSEAEIQAAIGGTLTALPQATRYPTATPYPTHTPLPTQLPLLSATAYPIGPSPTPRLVTATYTFTPPVTPRTPTATSRPGVLSSGVLILQFSQVIEPKSIARLKIQVQPQSICELTFYPPLGGPSKAPGLGWQKATPEGMCYWTWNVGRRTGQAKLRLVVNGHGQYLEMFILEKNP